MIILEWNSVLLLYDHRWLLCLKHANITSWIVAQGRFAHESEYAEFSISFYDCSFPRSIIFHWNIIHNRLKEQATNCDSKICKITCKGCPFPATCTVTVANVTQRRKWKVCCWNTEAGTAFQDKTFQSLASWDVSFHICFFNSLQLWSINSHCSIHDWGPDLVDFPTTLGPQTTGDGVKLARDIGASLVDPWLIRSCVKLCVFLLFHTSCLPFKTCVIGYSML